jgi:hypothetical protein
VAAWGLREGRRSVRLARHLAREYRRAAARPFARAAGEPLFRYALGLPHGDDLAGAVPVSARETRWLGAAGSRSILSWIGVLLPTLDRAKLARMPDTPRTFALVPSALALLALHATVGRP